MQSHGRHGKNYRTLLLTVINPTFLPIINILSNKILGVIKSQFIFGWFIIIVDYSRHEIQVAVVHMNSCLFFYGFDLVWE